MLKSVQTLTVYCVCGKNAPQLCKKCGLQGYCSRECQIADWKEHKIKCFSPEIREKQRATIHDMCKRVITHIAGNLEILLAYHSVVRVASSESLNDIWQRGIHSVHMTGLDPSSDSGDSGDMHDKSLEVSNVSGDSSSTSLNTESLPSNENTECNILFDFADVQCEYSFQSEINKNAVRKQFKDPRELSIIYED